MLLIAIACITATAAIEEVVDGEMPYFSFKLIGGDVVLKVDLQSETTVDSEDEVDVYVVNEPKDVQINSDSLKSMYTSWSISYDAEPELELDEDSPCTLEVTNIEDEGSGDVSGPAFTNAETKWVIKLKPSENGSPRNFSNVTLTLCRDDTKIWKDTEAIAAPITNHIRVMRASMKVLPVYGPIEISTIDIESPYSGDINLSLLNHNLSDEDDDRLSTTMYPVIATHSKMIGVDIYRDDVPLFWRNSRRSKDTMCFSMAMKARSDGGVNVSYLIMYVSSTSRNSAIELWHQAFPGKYNPPETGGGGWILPNCPRETCVWSDNERFEWVEEGDETTATSALKFYGYPQWSTETDKDPGGGACDGDAECEKIVEYGIRKNNGAYDCNEIDGKYICDLWWNSTLGLEGLPASVEWSGLGVDFIGAQVANYNPPYDNGVVYTLISEDILEVAPLAMYTYQFIRASRDKGYGILARQCAILPLFVSDIVSTGVESNIADAMSVNNDVSVYINDQLRRMVWSVRWAVGSGPVTIIEKSAKSNVITYFNDFMSLCLVTGAFPSFSSENSWTDDDCNNVYNKVSDVAWQQALTSIANNTIYYADMDGLIDITSEAGGQDEDMWESSMFCQSKSTAEDNMITCYVNVMLMKQTGDDNIPLNLHFFGEETPSCFFVSDGAKCEVSEHDAKITVSGSDWMMRTVTLSYRKDVDETVENWMEENFWIIAGVCALVLVVMVGMGIGVWCMFCRRRIDHEDLARIMDNARKERIRKDKLNTPVSDDSYDMYSLTDEE